MERNQALQQYTGWLHAVAYRMTTEAHHNDLVQEGYIAMWRALGTHDPAKSPLDFYLKRAARNRMKSIVKGETPTTNLPRKNATGFTQTRGNETRKRIEDCLAASPNATLQEIADTLGMSIATIHYHRKKMGTVNTAAALTKETVSIEAMTEAGWDLEGPGHLDGIEVAYHAGEIVRALDVLTPAQRRYVVARFWGGKNKAELTHMFGYDPTSLWRDAKPRLQTRLSYLRELVRS